MFDGTRMLTFIFNRKALKVVENLENVLAIELMAACQALEFRRPQLTTKPLEAVRLF